jgi:fatty acid desaturase
MLTTEELRTLAKPSPAATWKAVILDWLGIVLLFASAAYFHSFVVYVLCAVLIARQQLALAILMHDAAHSRLFESRVWNDYFSQILLASPLYFSMETYRKFHLKHHQDPLAPDDPDLSLIGGYPISKKSLARKLSRDLFAVSYFKFIRYFFFRGKTRPVVLSENVGKKGRSGRFSRTQLLVFHLAVNGLFFGILYIAGHPWLYLTLWILPMMTVLQVLLRIRGIAEHAGYQQGKDQALNSRTVVNPVQAFFFAPHNVNYHIEHHLYPGIPFLNLPKVHRLMRNRGSLPLSNTFPSYWAVLRSVTN